MSWTEQASKLADAKRISIYEVMRAASKLPYGYHEFNVGGVWWTVHKQAGICPSIGVAR